jgi:hypothetical protein
MWFFEWIEVGPAEIDNFLMWFMIDCVGSDGFMLDSCWFEYF